MKNFIDSIIERNQKIYNDIQVNTPRTRVSSLESSEYVEGSVLNELLEDEYFSYGARLVKQRRINPRKPICKLKKHQPTKNQEYYQDDVDDGPIQTKEQIEQDYQEYQKETKLVNTSLKDLPNQFKAKMVNGKPNNEELPEIQQFYNSYKRFERVSSVEDTLELKPGVHSRVLREVSRQNVFPKKINFIGSNTEITKSLKYNSKGLGNKYSNVLVAGINGDEFRQIKHIDLSDNRLSYDGIREALKIVTKNTTTLNLSQNLFDLESAKLLVPVLTNNQITLKYLFLSHCNLSEQASNLIFFALSKNNYLTKLDLSGNAIGDGCAEQLGRFIRMNSTLNEFYLRGNNIQSFCGNYLFKALDYNSTIRVLDLSHNGLGGGGNTYLAISETIYSKQCEISHLDLSYNHFTREQVKCIQDALLQNHSIYGLHFEGNGPYHVNYQGFLCEDSIKKKQKKKIKSELDLRIKGVMFNPNISNPYKFDFEREICWICDGWMQVRFVWQVNVSGEMKDGPLFVHLNFEDWKPIIMEKQIVVKQQPILKRRNSPVKINFQSGSPLGKITALPVLKKKQENQLIEEFYQIYKMCPPNSKIFYFFSNPEQNIQIHAEDQPYVPSAQCQTDVKQLLFIDGSKIEKQNISSYNVHTTYQSYVCDDKEDYQPVVRVLPRDNERKYLLNKFQRVKRRENILNRLVSHQKKTQFNLLDAFQIDYNISRMPKMVRQEYDKINFKDKLFLQYNGFRELFRFISSNNFQLIGNEYFYSISFKTFTKLSQGFGFLDEDKMKQTDMDINLLSLKVNTELKLNYNPEKSLIRYQFIEIFLRIALDRFLRNGQVKTVTDGFERLCTQHTLFGHCLQVFDNPQEWRERRLQTKECVFLFQLKQDFLKDLYDYVSDITKKKWYFKLKWVSLQEVLKFLSKQYLITEYLTERDLHIIVGLSIDNVIDDHNNDQYGQIHFNEFLEVLGRVAEVISPALLGQPFFETSLEERLILPLHIKLETLITYFVQTVIFGKEKPDYKELFNNEHNASYSLPLTINLQLRSSTTLFDLSDTPLTWEVMQQIDDICGVTSNKQGIPPQAFLFVYDQLKQPYIPESFWVYFKERDPTPVFESEEEEEEEEEEDDPDEDDSNIQYQQFNQR